MKITDLYESKFLTDKDEIIKWMNESFFNFKPDKLTFEPDGLVYDGYLNLNSEIDKLRVIIKSVTGYFTCFHTNITSLEGCPQVVGDLFNCSVTNITSLKYCPTLVRKDFHCRGIDIKDPKEYRFALYSEIGGYFDSSNLEIDKIVNAYKGSDKRKHWAYAINLLSKVEL